LEDEHPLELLLSAGELLLAAGELLLAGGDWPPEAEDAIH